MMYKSILVTETNYKKLKQFGSAGDSFNSVISNLLKEREELLRKDV